jgi:2-oxoisovalerate dehydrogenase E1 component alpha subunit
MGKNTDPLKGRQMPGHLGKKDINVFVLGSPVGVGHVVALGVSMGIKYRKEERVIISYGGEGATSEGHFHSALNFAGLFKLPLIVFVLNNLYAISVPRTMQTASPTIAIKGKAYNVEGYFVDGNDAIATYLVTKKCVYEAKKSKKPFLIEALTYRLDPHSSADDDKRYRARKEVEDWERKDGIVRLRKYLEYKGLWDNDKENALREKVTKKIEKAVEFAENAPLPDPKDMFYEVYKETPWYLVEEYKELKEEGI